MISEIITRLGALVLSGALHSVDGAKSFEDLRRRKAYPQMTPALFVVPLGISGRRVESAAGAFVQGIEESIGLILVIRNNTPAGERALEDLGGLVRSIIGQIAGWSPASATGNFRLLRAVNAADPTPGTIVYQIDFAIEDQLRIFS